MLHDRHDEDEDERTLEEILAEFDAIRSQHEPLEELNEQLLSRWTSAYRRWSALTQQTRSQK